jgi:hypothetical protein
MMARFWKRGADRSTERLLRANRPAPTDGFTSSLLRRIEGESPSRRISPRRYRPALVMAVLLVALAAALGGITAASAGVGSIVHAATKVVSPAKSDTSASSKQAITQSTSQTTNKDDDNKKDDDDDQGSSGGDQYSVLICDVEGNSGRVVLKSVGSGSVKERLEHHDYFPIDGHC